MISVLSDCHNDIDAAIKRLGDMRLRETDAGEQAGPSGQQPQREESSRTDGQMDQGLPQSSSEWVDKLVSEMSASRDVDEARGRGHRFLSTFESFISRVSCMHGEKWSSVTTCTCLT